MNKIYKSVLLGIVFSILSLTTKAQLAGTYSVPATFSTLASAINSLNIAGVNGTVTILISAGYTEAVPNGGYTLTATGTSTSPIIFQKNGVGANPLLIAYTGVGTPASAVQDGVLRLIGSDYITIDGININDPNITNPATMEFGYGLFKANASDGAQNNTIKNCVITLNKDNNAGGLPPAIDGSRGIEVVNALTNAHTAALTITVATGANSNNAFYNNLIQNVNVGISLSGFGDVLPYLYSDYNNDIGGLTSATSNTIINFGGATGGSPAEGVYTAFQYSLNVSNNLINSNNGAGVNHTGFLRGIFTNTANGASMSVNNNTITLHGGGNGWAVVGIHSLAGSIPNTNTVSFSNNLYTNSTYTTAINANHYGIFNQGAPAVLSVNGNTFSNNSTNATTGGQLVCVANSGSATTIEYLNNLLNLGTLNGAANAVSVGGIWNQGGSLTTTLTISGNTVQNLTYTTTGTGTHWYLQNTILQSQLTYSNNVINNITNNSTGTVYMLHNQGGAANTIVTGNSILTAYNKPNGGGTVAGYYGFGGAVGTVSISSNNFSSVNIGTASATFYGIYSSGLSTQSVIVLNNTVTAITNSNTGTTYGMLINYHSNIGNNIVSNFNVGGTLYGIYTTGNTFTSTVSSNTISALTSTGSTIYGMYQTAAINTSILKNRIFDLKTNGAFSAIYGLYFSGGTLYNLNNNLIGDIKAPLASNVNAVNGIYINSGTTFNVYYNTVYLNAASTGASFGSSAIYAATAPAVNLRNNIFINNSIPNGAAYSVAYRRSSTTLTSYSATSNNNIFYGGTPSANNLIHFNGTNSYSTMALYQTAVGPTRDNVSQTENTLFSSITGTNPSFLHINPNAPSLAESGAVNITGITDDTDLDIRQGNIGYAGTGTAPDIGADEVGSNVPLCNLVGPAVVTPSAVMLCDAQTTTMSASGYTTGTGITYQWQVSNTPGGPYTNVVGGYGQNYPILYTSATLTPNTYYYVLLTTCAISGNTATSNESTVTVLAYPTLTVTPNTATLCMPGGSSVTLNATGAVSYTWGPAAGLSGTVGVSVNALPTGSTIYTVTGVNAGGCASITTVSITVLEGPSIVTSLASPTVVCSGGSSSLQVTGATTSSYVVTNIPYSPIPTPSTGVITLCTNSAAVLPLSGGNLDDGGWANLSIPFVFNFYGVGYSNLAVSTNGFLYLGSGIPDFTGYGTAFPSPLATNPCIGSIYGDLQFSFSGTINTFTTGAAPNRKLVVNWSNGKYWTGGGTGSVTAQAVIFESANIIEVHTFENTGTDDAVQGIQDLGGVNSSTVANRNNQIWVVSTPDAYRWSPDGGPISYTWTPATYLTGTNIPNPIANTVTSSVTYSVLLSGVNGCTNNAVLQLNADITPTVAITGSNSICTSNTLNLTASGAATYSWNNGVTTSTLADTPTITTTYSVVGSSSLGCTATAVKIVTVNTTPTVTIAGASSVCAGYSINLIASGANSYSWSNGSTLSVIAPSPTTSITYTVVGTSSAGCVASIASKTISVAALPTVTITAPGTICVGEPITLAASGLGVDSYSWSTGATSAVIVENPTVSLIYTIYVKNDFTGCVNSKSKIITVNACVGLEELSAGLEGLSVYPNPNVGVFTVELVNGKEKSVEVTDVIGRVIKSDKTIADKLNVDITQLANGIYYVKVISNSASQVYKIVKQ